MKSTTTLFLVASIASALSASPQVCDLESLIGGSCTESALLVKNDTPSGDTHCQSPSQDPCTSRYGHRFQIGGNYTYAWITPEQNSTTSGSMGGGQAIYEYCYPWAPYFGVAFDFKIGRTSDDVGTRSLNNYNPQVRVGYTLSCNTNSLAWTFFTGLGARYMAETVKISTTSLDFDYTEFYVPIGFLFEKMVISCFSIGCNFQWMPQVFPLVQIDPLSGARWDLTYQLANFFVEVPFKVYFFDDCRYSLSINPYFESWRNGQSTAITQTNLPLNLPGNKYIFTGLNLNLVFAF